MAVPTANNVRATEAPPTAPEHALPTSEHYSAVGQQPDQASTQPCGQPLDCLVLIGERVHVNVLPSAIVHHLAITQYSGIGPTGWFSPARLAGAGPVTAPPQCSSVQEQESDDAAHTRSVRPRSRIAPSRNAQRRACYRLAEIAQFPFPAALRHGHGIPRLRGIDPDKRLPISLHGLSAMR